MAIKKYITLNKLKTFLSEARQIFAPISHTHTTSEIEDYTVDAALSNTSTNPIQNKTVKSSIDQLNDKLDAKIQFITWESDD